MLAASFLFGAPAHGGALGQGQIVDPARLVGPDQEHAQHPPGLIDRGRGALLPARKFEERVGRRNLPTCDARMPVSFRSAPKKASIRSKSLHMHTSCAPEVKANHAHPAGKSRPRAGRGGIS